MTQPGYSLSRGGEGACHGGDNFLKTEKMEFTAQNSAGVSQGRLEPASGRVCVQPSVPTRANRRGHDGSRDPTACAADLVLMMVSSPQSGSLCKAKAFCCTTVLTMEFSSLGTEGAEAVP
ncbi:Fras1-Related Extracellular Matrix Protein 1 [Manis pentadactyla]|nr:Fras1-Related Extracellular Matrix Protein 1 [Manis pentadactyla]